MSYFPDDSDEDKKADETLKGEATVPPDLEAAETSPEAGHAEGPPSQPPVSLADLSDEDLAAELARRKTAKIDMRIIEVQSLLASLIDERDRLIADPSAVFDAAAFSPGIKVNIVTASQVPGVATDINPVTGKRRTKKPLQGTVPHSQCDCRTQGIEGGCYKCLSAGAATKLGPAPAVEPD